MVRQATAFCMKISATSGPNAAVSWSTWLELYFVMWVFSFSSASPRNAHVADAQLPAYWRIEGRNETRSGRRLPSTGKIRIATSTATRIHGVMSPSPKPLCAGYSQNRNDSAKMKNTFHSSGTASGNVDVMNAWKVIMPNDREQASASGWSRTAAPAGRTSSTVVPPMWANELLTLDGRMSRGQSR